MFSRVFFGFQSNYSYPLRKTRLTVLPQIFQQLDTASEAFEKAKAVHDNEREAFTIGNQATLLQGVTSVEDAWQLCLDENREGYCAIKHDLDTSTRGFPGIARAISVGVLQRETEVEALVETFAETDTHTKELTFLTKAVRWPTEACCDFLKDTEGDQKRVATACLEKIHDARTVSSKERRECYTNTFGKIAAAIDGARETDGDRILKVRERTDLVAMRFGVELRPS